MNPEKMGCFIAELRKSKQMTQKQLADQLHLTDKAISKWERGMGYPDITVLTALAKALDVTTGELLSGERAESIHLVNESVVQDTLQYAHKLQGSKTDRFRRIAHAIFAGSLATAVLVCIICDLAVSGGLSWSLYPIGSTLFTWLVFAPLFSDRPKKYGLIMLSLSVFIFPYLYLLQKLQGGGWFWPVGVPVSCVGLAFLWIIYLLLGFKRLRRLSVAAIICLLLPILPWVINGIVAKYVGSSNSNGWNIFSSSVLLFLSLLLWLISLMRGFKNHT